MRCRRWFTVPARAATHTSPQAVAYAWAVAQHGKPFEWAGAGPSGYDCSGLVYAAYRHAGIVLPRDTYSMVRSRQLVRISRTAGPPGGSGVLRATRRTRARRHGRHRECGVLRLPARPARRMVLDSRWWTPDAFYRVRDTG